jgi:fucose permease
MGIAFGFLGPSLPSLGVFLNIDLEKAGLLTAGIQLGYGVMGVGGGILSDFIRRDKVLMSGCFVLGLSALLFGLRPLFSLNLLLMTLMGLGCGLILSSSNALMVGLYPERKGSILNIHHIFAATGSLVGPLIMGYLISRQIKWQYGYEGLGFLVLFLSAFFIFTKVPDVEIKSKVKFSQIGHLLRQKDFLLMVIVNFLAMGTQFALIYLSVTFLKEAKGFSIGISSVVLSSFFILMILGRLVCGWLSARISNSAIILTLLLFLLIVVFAIWAGQGWVSAGAVMLSGLACSGIFPCLLALAGTLFHDVTGTALGVLGMTSGLGGMSACWLTALISQRTDVGVGFVVVIISSFMALVLFSTQYRSLLRKENKHGALINKGNENLNPAGVRHPADDVEIKER